MAKAPKPAIDPEALFDVRVNKVIKAAGQTFRPSGSYTVKGKVLAELGDAVVTATPID